MLTVDNKYWIMINHGFAQGFRVVVFLAEHISLNVMTHVYKEFRWGRSSCKSPERSNSLCECDRMCCHMRFGWTWTFGHLNVLLYVMRLKCLCTDCLFSFVCVSVLVIMYDVTHLPPKSFHTSIIPLRDIKHTFSQSYWHIHTHLCIYTNSISPQYTVSVLTSMLNLGSSPTERVSGVTVSITTTSSKKRSTVKYYEIFRHILTRTWCGPCKINDAHTHARFSIIHLLSFSHPYLRRKGTKLERKMIFFFFMHKTFACMAVVIFQASSSSNASISERRMKEKRRVRWNGESSRRCFGNLDERT